MAEVDPTTDLTLPPLERNPGPRKRSLGGWLAVLVVIAVVIAVGAKSSTHASNAAPKYTKDETANFALIAGADPVIAPIFQGDPAGLVKTAEDACTYRSEGHSESELLNNLETTGGAPESLSQSLAYDSELAFCPNLVGH